MPPDDSKCQQTPDGRRVVLEGLTVNHYQMTGSTNESLLASSCQDAVDGLPDGGTVPRCFEAVTVEMLDGLSVFSFIYFLLYIYYWVKFFD